MYCRNREFSHYGINEGLLLLIDSEVQPFGPFMLLLNQTTCKIENQHDIITQNLLHFYNKFILEPMSPGDIKWTPACTWCMCWCCFGLGAISLQTNPLIPLHRLTRQGTAHVQ